MASDGHSSAPGVLPPGTRHAIRRDRPAGTGPHGTVHSDREVSGHGDDLLASRDRGGTGTGEGTMRDYEALLIQALALLQQETSEQCYGRHRISVGRRYLLKMSLQCRMHVYKRLSIKSFHGVSSANAHECSL